jgi:hypothetical protein
VVESGGMGTSSPPIGTISTWKRIAIISFFSGFGVALAAALILGGFIWYTSRPTPPKSWNTSALVASGPPKCDAIEDGKRLELRYSVKNSTAIDYSLDAEAANKLRVMAKYVDGHLSQPVENANQVDAPVFIPAGQLGALTLAVRLSLSDLPTRGKAESEDDYRERLLAHLESTRPDIAGFALYDETNRYQIDLPKWAELTAAEQAAVQAAAETARAEAERRRPAQLAAERAKAATAAHLAAYKYHVTVSIAPSCSQEFKASVDGGGETWFKGSIEDSGHLDANEEVMLSWVSCGTSHPRSGVAVTVNGAKRDVAWQPMSPRSGFYSAQLIF